MKKKLKIFLLSALAIILIGVGYIVYVFQFKEYEVADDEVAEIMENPYDITLPNGTKLKLDGEEPSDGKDSGSTSAADDKPGDKTTADGSSSSETAGESKTDSSTTTGTDGAESGGTAGNSTTGSTDKSSTATADQPAGDKTNSNKTDSKEPASKPAANGNTGSAVPGKQATVSTIKGKYKPTINELQSQVDGKINSLIGRAKNEYATKKANGESVNYAYFYNKYMSAAEGLEAQTDAVFNGVVSSLEKDLQANGYDKSYSKSVRDEYAAQKKARRDSIMNKAMGK